MTVVGAIRSSDVDLPLIVHVLGAMALVGLLVAASVSLVLAWRVDDADAARGLTRFGLWSLVAGVLPAWVVMRVGAQWVYSREGWDEAPEEPGWLGVGYLTADLGGIVLAVAILLAIVGLRRLGQAERPPGVARVAGAIAALMLAAYVVAIWAMTAKPD
jgi:hypothetical protein